MQCKTGTNDWLDEFILTQSDCSLGKTVYYVGLKRIYRIFEYSNIRSFRKRFVRYISNIRFSSNIMYSNKCRFVPSGLFYNRMDTLGTCPVPFPEPTPER